MRIENKSLLYWAAGLCIFALAAHAIDARDHLREWWLFGTLFVISGTFQFFLGLGLLVRPWRYDENGGLRENPDYYGRPFYFIGIALASFVILLYLVTRTSGLPFLGMQAAAIPVTPLSLFPVIEDIPIIILFSILLYQTKHLAIDNKVKTKINTTKNS